MKNKWLILLCSLFFVCGNAQIEDDCTGTCLKITWVKKLKSDFSFINNWEYPLGVEKKADGKAGCADGGFCPERCYGMMDTNGIVIKDSAEQFYSLLDTTHIPFSIQCEASCGEFAGVNIAHAMKLNDGRIFCFTETGIATHCYLELIIENSDCTPVVRLNSIISGNPYVFEYKSGNMIIDKSSFKKGILKVEFDLQFHNNNPESFPVWWKGKIHAKIEPMKNEK